VPALCQVTYWAVGGDFGEAPNDAQFCCNGLMWPDRSPHPAYWEAAACMAPLAFELLAPRTSEESMCLECTSRYDVLGTDHLALQWRLVVHGLPTGSGADDRRDCGRLPSSSAPPHTHAHMAVMLTTYNATARVAGADEAVLSASMCPTPPGGSGWLGLEAVPNIPPRGKASVRLPFSAAVAARTVGAASKAAPPQQNDVILEVRAVLRSDTEWGAPAGHVVAAVQLPLGDVLAALWLLPGATSGTPPSESPSAREVPARLASVVSAGVCGARGGVHEHAPPSSVQVEALPNGDLRVIAGSKRTSVSGQGAPVSPGLALVVSGSSGLISELSWGGQALLAAPLAPCLMRAATDNDRGGSGGSSHAGQWMAAGLDRLQLQGQVCAGGGRVAAVKLQRTRTC